MVDTDHSVTLALLPSLLGALCVCFWVMDIPFLYFYYYLISFLRRPEFFIYPFILFSFSSLSLPFLLRLILCMYAGKVKKEGSIILGERY
ncbi:hypothetical protein BO85DRAFT_68690 [Aspergillus piperis CBS 112811]|uniref:Uncharacterized protein n=1 Tax=Aspergillus piperis CBS 112811 TaxID=1448313 RepID=A0A8G1VJW5_9EURO|nr:hypothetical protein BO85DRAFT_68690 [Aspergillus piperis CBS 112811]RAH55881.1 hypothetical protein BO85DRAFT_68690 [Aspergillus piperis CBS 112811]